MSLNHENHIQNVNQCGERQRHFNAVTMAVSAGGHIDIQGNLAWYWILFSLFFVTPTYDIGCG